MKLGLINFLTINFSDKHESTMSQQRIPMPFKVFKSKL